jgi:hypothetical protein
MRAGALIAASLLACGSATPATTTTTTPSEVTIAPADAHGSAPVIDSSSANASSSAWRDPPPSDECRSTQPWPRGEGNPALAQALFDEGRKLYMQGDFMQAREKLEASFHADPAAGTLLNLAVCEEKLGDLRAAREHYAMVCEEATRSGRQDRAELARQKLRALGGRKP